MKRALILGVRVFAVFLAPILGYFPGSQPQQAFAAEVKTYSFGVVPQFEQRKLYATWKPIVDNLETRTGLKFNLVTALKIQDFEKAIAQGKFDFVYVNPYHLIQVHDAQGYVPLVTDDIPVRGILVARKGSAISKPEDLNGKTVAFPSPNALGASLLVRADLQNIFHTTVTPLYVTTHSSVYLHVIKDLAAAGGGVEKTLQEQDESIRSQLRVIYTTRPCPSHPVAAHPRVPKAAQEKVRQALLDMSTTAQGKEMLRNIPVRQFVPVSYDDYGVMRDWGLEKYWQPLNKD
ncbi:phosphate/phosphite/phosphonate ABC transporter substrate-binding protein [Rhodoferax sp.]|uniref:phosphate/phosphite/phosphonate ABC transporter substrate-binding protein n=1 Tax=Rhodoferax sp. TaxID=50421 RepID=UPI0028453D79|nr:phosphate/phosphite/phosphonate ABC transporter substrate-binding protein [Rhodoferax sp.]MDR3371843.1 phosphate/phosphite/phosphonate ABC transporter substrate-binding protein [Rhodoferax sp.]